MLGNSTLLRNRRVFHRVEVQDCCSDRLTVTGLPCALFLKALLGWCNQSPVASSEYSLWDYVGLEKETLRFFSLDIQVTLPQGSIYKFGRDVRIITALPQTIGNHHDRNVVSKQQIPRSTPSAIPSLAAGPPDHYALH